jgi:hypothetical protein
MAGPHNEGEFMLCAGNFLVTLALPASLNTVRAVSGPAAWAADLPHIERNLHLRPQISARPISGGWQGVYEQNLNQTEAHLDRLRFLRYRKEVISGWRASEEKRIRLEAIQREFNALAAISAVRLGYDAPTQSDIR